MSDKATLLSKLTEKRKNTCYEGYTSIGDYHDGVYECDFVSPYTKSAGNTNSDIMIILQDWCSEAFLLKKICSETLKYGYDPSIRTNIKLKELLLEHLEITLAETYGTNLFPFIKPGPMHANIPAKDMKRAALDFTIPLIDIVEPKIAICFGTSTFNALRKACGLRPVKNMAEAIDDHFSYNKTEIWCQAHTGQLGQNNRNRGGVDRVSSDWEKMRQYFQRL